MDAAVLHKALQAGICLGLPGVSVSIATSEGVVWSGADGYSNLEEETPLSSDHRFCVGSITKTFVAVVIWSLIEEGKLSLESTALEYLNEKQYHVVSRIANTSSATIRQLLCHQSGIPSWEFETAWIRRARGAELEPGAIWDKTETLQYVMDTPPVCHPGEQFSYSNTNHTILGLVIEAITGNEVVKEIRNRIVEPLGLSSAYMDSFESAKTTTGVAARDDVLTKHYHFVTDDFVQTAGLSNVFQPVVTHKYLVNTSAANLSAEWAAGGMILSMHDLALYGCALRDLQTWSSSSRLSTLSEETAQEMFTYQPPSSNIMGDDGSGVLGKSLKECGQEYCPGLCRTLDTAGLGPSYGHDGLTLGFSSKLLWLENYDCVVACATNVGSMHSGFDTSPWELFVKALLLPAVKEYLSLGVKDESPI